MPSRSTLHDFRDMARNSSGGKLPTFGMFLSITYFGMAIVYNNHNCLDSGLPLAHKAHLIKTKLLNTPKRE